MPLWVLGDPDIKADFLTDFDREEPVSMMEPTKLGLDSRERIELVDLSIDLASKSASLKRSLPDGVCTGLAELVRTMNCYYSNLIEGHNTHPIAIERAMNKDYSDDPKQRDLQKEAVAHIAVQQWIDEGGLVGRATRLDSIKEVHARFYEHLPNEFRYVEDQDSGEKIEVIPGELRKRDVKVGHHVAVSPGAVERFLRRFEEVYSGLGKTEALLSIAAAHHRLLWIHPFLDGNGRVARLISYAQMLEHLNTGGVWSIARGLARSEQEYKSHLMACDRQREHDTDGRGNLSESALMAFTKFFLLQCLDQVSFMEQLMEPSRLRERILTWVERQSKEEHLLPNAKTIVEAVLYRGYLPRAEIPELLGVGDRQARRTLSGLLDTGVLQADNDRAPVRLSFPSALAAEWMPGLFPPERT